MKPDKIKIEDLEVFANHGVFPEENVLGQKFVVSAVMYTDTRRAGLTDELTASIHYGEASAFITEYLKSHTFKLLEKVAEGLAEEMLVRIAGLQKVQIEIKKPWAPVGLPLKTVSVEIEREWHTAYIALGSNMGDSRSILEAAVQALDEMKNTKVEKVSTHISRLHICPSEAMDCHQCDGSSSMCTSGIQVPLPVDEALHQELRKNCCLHF